MSETFEGWTEFNLAMVGAATALAGLLIVAMSVNIAAIMKAAVLPARAAASIAALVLAMVAAAFGLIPGQLDVVYGVEVIVATALAAIFQVHSMRVIIREDEVSTSIRWTKSATGLIPIGAFLVGGVLIVAGSTDTGLVAVAIGSVTAIVAAIILAWVVLVEVLR
jgi:hypothetical protein